MIQILKIFKERIDYNLVSIHLLIIIFFGVLYWLATLYEIKNKLVPKNHFKKHELKHLFLRSIAFAAITQTTIGYGNFSPPSYVSQLINLVHIFIVVLSLSMMI